MHLERRWLPFKYENLSFFCFGCGRLGHAVKDCGSIIDEAKAKEDHDFSYSIALRVEFNMFGKEKLLLSIENKKTPKIMTIYRAYGNERE